MLKKIRNTVALATLLALGACNSVTAPLGQADEQDDQGKNKDHRDAFVSAQDVTPGGDGGGGIGPGDKDDDESRERDRERDEWTPDA